MKIKYLLPILSVPFSTFLVQQSSAENLFVNAGFEDYAPLPNDNVAWDRRGETVTLTRVTSPVQEGTYSLLVDGRNPAQSWNGVRHVVLLLPNQIYRLTGHARMASSTGTLQVKLIKFDDGGVKLPEQLIVDVPGLDNTLFKPFEIYFSFPETNVAETILSFHTLAGSADGEAFLVDNLSLEENPTLLANPGIEATIGSNDWKPRGGTTITPITSPVDEGTYALEVTGRDAGFDGVQQALLGILSQDTVYRISGSLRMVSGAAPDTIKVQLIKNGDGGSPVTVATVANVDDSAFKTFSKTFSFGSEVTTGLELSVGGLTSPTASFIIDGFSIEEVPFDYLTNPDFENDIDTAFNSGWDPRGGTTLTLIPSPVSSGTRALEVTGRDNNFDGVQQKVFGVLSQDTLYRISGDLRMSSGEALDTIKVQLIVNGVGASPITLATVTDVVDSSFTSFATTFSFGAEVTSNLQLAIGGLGSTTASFIADNFSIQAVPPFALLLNPGFEYPIDTNTGKGWDPRGVTAADLVPVSSPVTEGASAIKVINRTGTFNGIKQDMLGTLQPDINYRISGDVRLVGSASDSVEVQLLKEDGINPTVFDPIASATATDTGWTSFANTFTYSETGLVELDLSVHGPASGVDLIIDNLRLERLPELVNPSFEDIPVVDDGLGWDQRGTASLTQVISPTPADGTYAIEVANRTAPFNGVRQSLLPITKPNTLYRISGKVRMGAGETDDLIRVQLLKDDGSGQVTETLYTFAAAQETNPSTADGWSQFIATIYYTERDLTQLDLSIHGPANLSGGTGPELAVFLVDDCLLEEMTPDFPISNPSFETAPVEADNLAWDKRGDATLTQVLSPTPVDGTYALLVDNRTNTWNGVKYANLDLDPGYTYQITGHVRMDAGEAADTIQIQVIGTKENGDPYFGSNITVANVTDAAWTEFSGVLTVPDNLANMEFSIHGPVIGAAFLVDNIDLFTASPVFEDFMAGSFETATAQLNFAAASYDYDRDGLDNFFEWLFGYDPFVVDAPGGALSFIQQAGFIVDGDRTLAWSFPMRDGATGVLAQIEESSDLSSWLPTAEAQTLTGGSVANGIRQMTVEVILSAPHPDKEFYRFNLDAAP